jgi:hypothetical protein
VSRALVAAVGTRLETMTGRTVYRHAVPKSPVDRYLFVYSGAGLAQSDNFPSVDVLRDNTVYVTSTSIGEQQAAADEATWDAEHAQSALINWRPTIGAASWRPTHLSSQPVRRDDSLPDVTAMFAVDAYQFIYQP